VAEESTADSHKSTGFRGSSDDTRSARLARCGKGARVSAGLRSCFTRRVSQGAERSRDQDQAADHLAGTDARGDRSTPQRLVAQAGRPADAAGRLPGADGRASERAGTGDPARRVRRARGGDGEHRDRQDHWPGRPPRDLRRSGLVGRRQAALCRRRLRRPHLSLRPRRGSALEQDDVPSPRSREKPQGSRRTGPVGRWQDPVGRQRLRPLAWPARHDRGHDPRPDPAGGRFLPVRTGLGRVSQTFVRQPLEPRVCCGDRHRDAQGCRLAADSGASQRTASCPRR